MRQTFEGIETPRQYWSNQPLGQPRAGTIIAGYNVVFDNGRSRAIRSYEPVGTVTPDLAGVVGTVAGTQDRVIFELSLSDLRDRFAPFSWVLVGRELHVVRKLVAVSLTQSAMVLNPTTQQVGAVTVRCTPTLFPIVRTATQRGSQWAGSTVLYRAEAYFGAGRGNLEIDGSALEVPLPVARTPKVAYPTAGGFDVRPAGYSKPLAPTVVSAVGGTRGMEAGERSIRVAHAREGFRGHGLASDPVAATTVNVAANGKITVTAQALPTGIDGTNAIHIYATKRGDAKRGPWYLYKKLVGAGPHDVEFLDEELTELYQEEAYYEPPKCLRVVDFGDLLLYVSFADATDAPNTFEESGACIAIAKASDPEAFSPVGLAFVIPTEPIVGAHVGQRYAFFLTESRLNVGQRTANNVAPLVIFPYGQTGFAHQGNAVVIDDVFYGLTGAAIVRTVNGEDLNTELTFPIKREFEAVEPARTILGYDGIAQRLVVFENMAMQGAGGKWQCRAFSCNLNDLTEGRPTWNAPALLGDGVTDDFHVTGVVTINSQLFFTTAEGQVFAWDKGSNPVAGWLATNFAGVGARRKRDTLREMKVAGGINGSYRLFRDLNLAALLANSTNGSVAFTLANATNQPNDYPVAQLRWPGLNFAVRFDFNQPGGSSLLDVLEVLTVQRGGVVE